MRLMTAEQILSLLSKMNVKIRATDEGIEITKCSDSVKRIITLHSDILHLHFYGYV